MIGKSPLSANGLLLYVLSAKLCVLCACLSSAISIEDFELYDSLDKVERSTD